jgi:hypothetical protein
MNSGKPEDKSLIPSFGKAIGIYDGRFTVSRASTPCIVIDIAATMNICLFGTKNGIQGVNIYSGRVIRMQQTLLGVTSTRDVMNVLSANPAPNKACRIPHYHALWPVSDSGSPHFASLSPGGSERLEKLNRIYFRCRKGLSPPRRGSR